MKIKTAHAKSICTLNNVNCIYQPFKYIFFSFVEFLKTYTNAFQMVQPKDQPLHNQSYIFFSLRCLFAWYDTTDINIFKIRIKLNMTICWRIFSHIQIRKDNYLELYNLQLFRKCKHCLYFRGANGTSVCQCVVFLKQSLFVCSLKVSNCIFFAIAIIACYYKSCFKGLLVFLNYLFFEQ